MKNILVLFFSWRLLLCIPLLIGEQLLKFRAGYDYVSLDKVVAITNVIRNIFLYPWGSFDGVHYLSIAVFGYSNDFGFFPLYPLLIRIVATVFGMRPQIDEIPFFAALLLSDIFFLASLFVFYKLIRLDHNESVTFRSVFFLLLFPASFFFVSLYAESLFFLLLLLSFYFARKKQWFTATIFGVLLSATRLVGIFILPALLYEYFREGGYKERGWKGLLPLLLIPVGTIAFSIYNFILTSNFFAFISAQGNFGNNRSVDTIVLIPQTLVRYAKILTSLSQTQYEWWISLLEVGLFSLVCLLLFYAWRKHVRASYLLFSLLAFLLPVHSGTFTGLPRYAIVLFPIYIAFGLIHNVWIRTVILVLSTLLLSVLLMFFSKGYFVA